jgi:H+/Cl- antiporter ClcA
MGNEGPTIQIASGIFFSIGKRFQNIWPQMKPEFFIVAGAGAGMAAGFNTPLGGIVYAIEEFSSTQLQRFKSALISAVIIAGLVAQALVGSYLYLGFPRLEPMTAVLYPWVIVLALLGGLWGAFFAYLAQKSAVWRLRKFQKIWQRILLAACMGLLVAALYQFASHSSVGAGKNVVTDLLFNKNAQADTSLVITRFLSPLISYISGCAGGLFAPALAAGGSLGALFAKYADPVHVNILILVGMIAFMTGVTRLPFTSFVLVLEMTDRHSAIFPMMLAALLAQASARLVDKQNLYHRLMPIYKARLKKDPRID